MTVGDATLVAAFVMVEWALLVLEFIMCGGLS